MPWFNTTASLSLSTNKTMFLIMVNF